MKQTARVMTEICQDSSFNFFWGGGRVINIAVENYANELLNIKQIEYLK